VSKPVFPSVVADTYLYEFGGYVFGLNNPAVPLQQISLTDQSGQPVGIQSTGPLMVGFVADPLRAGLPWWRQAYTLPDVGVNHPERWDWSRSTQTASFNFADASVPPQDQGFYLMKGFFITPAGAGGVGPTRTTATAGDHLELTARVYNFSPVDTNDPTLTAPAASIHVRFYGQAFDTSTGMLVGSAFLIGETEVDFITGFNSPTTAPGGSNWTLASVPFDTTPYPDTSLVFWVVVWMEDALGNLVPEIPDHGLTANPALATVTQVTDVPVEAHSNNLGLYGADMPFYIAAASATETGAGIVPAFNGNLTLAVTVPDSPVALDRKVRITAELRAPNGLVDGVPVAFYDGNPRRNGKLFGFQHVPRVRSDEPHLVRAFFRPQACGRHAIAVVAGAGTATPAEALAFVDVTQDPIAAVNALIATLHRLGLVPGPLTPLARDLKSAVLAVELGRQASVVAAVVDFVGEVRRYRGDLIPAPQADQLIGQALLILQCAPRQHSAPDRR
jgi:hypothetical protein